MYQNWFRPQTCPNHWKCTFADIDKIVYKNRIWKGIHINYAYPYCRHSKSFTGIGEIVNQYWWNHMPVLMKLYTSIRKKLTFSSFLISSIFANDFVNTGKRFHQYRYTLFSVPVNDFRVSAKKICINNMYALPNSRILVYNLANMGNVHISYWYVILRLPLNDFVDTGKSTFSEFWTGLRMKSKIIKNMGGGGVS